MELNSNTYFGNTKKVEQYLKELSENHQRINYGKLNKNILEHVPQYLTLLKVTNLQVPEDKKSLLKFTEDITNNYYDCENYIGYAEYESDKIVSAYDKHKEINTTIKTLVDDFMLSFPLKPTDVTREDMNNETRLYKLTAYTNFVKEIATKIVFLPLDEVMKNVVNDELKISNDAENNIEQEEGKKR